MNTINSKGIDMPELDLSNFRHKETNTINILEYLYVLTNIMNTLEDEDAKADFKKTYLIDRCRDIPEFREGYSTQFYYIRRIALVCKVKDAFEVGKFYTIPEVEDKLDKLYFDYDMTMEEYEGPKVADLEENNWFKYERTEQKLNGTNVDGIIITECLIQY